jgi:hypothetical protein
MFDDENDFVNNERNPLPNTLDDKIVVCHVIVCFSCSLQLTNAAFISMNDWLNHKKETGHRKSKHTVSIRTEDDEFVLTFNRSTKNA